jgi:hypothetical protein
MKYEDFMQSVAGDDAPGAGLCEELRSLWYAAKGAWDAAHEVAQEIHSPDGSWIHAHLHRQEGDLGNAGYWYNRAGQAICTDSLDLERASLIRHFLDS